MRKQDEDQIFPHQLTLSLLGSQILTRCKHEECSRGIAAHFSSAVSEPWTTPDIIVDCTWKTAERYLFRARESERTGPLSGVRVHTLDALAKLDWPFLSPPIPPLVVEPLRNRFIALHGAAIRAPDGRCFLVLGDRESGKTTTALELVNNQGWTLLTDETVFIHRRARLVEPFAPSLGVWDDEGGTRCKKAVPAMQACLSVAREPALATHVICLERVPSTGNPELRRLAAADAFGALLRHQLDAGSSWEESIISLAHLARTLPVTALHHGGYADLRAVIPEMLNIA
jgi:hypothetical protein